MLITVTIILIKSINIFTIVPFFCNIGAIITILVYLIQIKINDYLVKKNINNRTNNQNNNEYEAGSFI